MSDDEELPLAGLRVLDISTFIAAPAAAVALADYGADVIKIEAPGEGDPHRYNYKRAGTYPKSENNFPLQLDGRLKRSLAIDLKHEKARPILDELIRRSDVLIANFPPPVRERLKLRWEDVEPLNPKLVYCSLTGYGESGPDRDRPGFDITAYFGRSGILDAARYEGGPPGISLPAQGDRATAMTLVAAILMGLRRRDRTGKGSWVGTSLYANGAWANGTTLAGVAIGAQVVTRDPPDRPKNALANLYRTRDERWLQLLIVRDDRMWPAFCDAIGRKDLESDPRFTDREERKSRAKELHAEIAPIFASKTYAECAKALAAAGIPFGVIERTVDVVDDEQARHAGIFNETTNPDVPRTVNNPIRLGFAKPRVSGIPASVGQNSEEILKELGHSAAEIETLKKAGVLG
jgi:crotonobetainyl-CoA:carnitine CoA-transferase CaiB-like acyl-CoA transferase